MSLGDERIRDRKRRETREAVFIAAIDEFFTSGVAAAKIERIVEKAGVARGTFYFHFPTKDHVLYELTDRSESLIVESMTVSADAPLADVVVAVFACIRASMQTINGDVRRELLAAQMRRPMSLDAPPTPLHARLAAAIERSQRCGEARADLKPLDAARTLLMSAFGVIALAPSDDAANESLDLLIEMTKHGVLVERPSLLLEAA